MTSVGRGAESCLEELIVVAFFVFFFLRGMKINYVSCLITLIFNLEGNWGEPDWSCFFHLCWSVV